MNRLTILSFIILLFSIPCLAQNQYPTLENQNEQSYWVWRDRFVNDFMVPGTGTGCGIIIKGRGGYDNHNGLDNEWDMGGFSVGDDGWQMGYYMAVLATEWKLLHEAGQPTHQTEVELYYELQTLLRLDNSAEIYWAQSWGNNWANHWIPNNPNGFMIRDDIFDETNPYSVNPFISPNSNYGTATGSPYANFLHLNSGVNGTTGGKCGKYCNASILPYSQSNHYYMPLSLFNTNLNPNHGANQTSAAETGIHASDGYNHVWGTTITTGPEEVSQDNYIGMMIGLCTIVKCFPTNWNINPPDNCSSQFNIPVVAGTILTRIIHFMQNSSGQYGGSSGVNFSNPWKFHSPVCINDNCWNITNPVTGLCVKGCFWKDYFANFNQNLPVNPACQCNSGGAQGDIYSNAYVQINNSFLGSDGSLSPCTTPLVYNNSDLDVSLFALSNMGASNVAKDTNFPYLSINQIKSNSDACYLVDQWKDCVTISPEYEFLDLLYTFFYGGLSVRMTNTGSNNCFGKYGQNYYDNFLSNYGCSSSYITGGSNLLPQMLVHNLLKLYRKHSYTNPQSNIITDAATYPFNDIQNSNEIIGTGNNNNSCTTTSQQEEILTAYNTINSTANIGQLSYNGCTWNGWVQYIAGKEVDLQPGFDAKSSAYFDAKIGTGSGSCQVTPNGDYVWLSQSCPPCTPPYTFSGLEFNSGTGSNCPNECSWILSDCQNSQTCIAASWFASCSMTINVDPPKYCIANLSGGYYQWSFTLSGNTTPTLDTTTSTNTLTISANSLPCGGYCNWTISVNYIQGGTSIASITKTHEGFSNCGYGGGKSMKINTDSSTTINHSTSNVNNNNENKIMIYPNPAVDIINIDLPNSSDNKQFELTLTDILGNVVTVNYKYAQKSININVSNLARGVYFLKISNNSYVKTEKIILK